MEKALNLEKLVKFVEIEKAKLNNIPLKDCIGEVSRPVTNGSITFLVKTKITAKDIQDYKYLTDPIYFCFADCLPE